MPTYEYVCKSCGFEFEQFQSMKDDPIKDCPQCDHPDSVQRLIGCGAGIIFKGAGFYETDYKRKSAPSEPSGERKDSSESKTETKTGMKTDVKIPKEMSGVNGKVKSHDSA